MKELKYNEWSKISIGLYKQIESINNEEGIDDITKEVEILSLLSDLEQNEIWNLPITEINNLRQQCMFLKNFTFPKDKKITKIKIGEYDCNVCTNLSKFTYSQYVDFQMFFQRDGDLAYLLSTIIVPDGKKYGDGYDLDDFIKHITEEVSIVDGNVICFFLLKCLVSSIRRMNLYLLAKLRMRKMITKKKNPIYQKLNQAIEMTKQINSILTSHL